VPFFISRCRCYPARQSVCYRGFHDASFPRAPAIAAIEALLREHQQWQSAPDASVFNSTQPFCMDTLEPYEWLQWVLIPRMHALLDGEHPLPESFAIAPYYEIALEATHPARDVILVQLQDSTRSSNDDA
jgi:uncharacterized protein YqcC (DUF446 family)